MECVFCKIVEGKEPAKKVYENERVVAFHTIVPEADFHVLVIPKRHVVKLHELDDETAFHLLSAIHGIAKKENLQHFRIVNKNGSSAGQRVPHLHIHILSGNLPLSILPK